MLYSFALTHNHLSYQCLSARGSVALADTSRHMAKHADREADIAGNVALSREPQQSPAAQNQTSMSRDEAEQVLARHFAATTSR
jgi:hypothetical protein|eukprot:COSAG02_NODE_334_length_24367_cov_6.715634_14_plen_84_part_00